MFKIVVSGVNLTDSGKLSVLQDCLSTLKQIKTQKKLDVTVLVHRTQLVKDYQDDFTIIEYPEVKSSWFKRINFEYFHSKTLSLQIKPHLWINLHDVSANVICPYKVVYCHNPSPFYKIDYQNFFIDITFSMFCLFYKYLYGINIKSNSFVIVQQNWLRKKFEEIYKVKTIIAYPEPVHSNYSTTLNDIQHLDIDFTKTTFFYPSYPRVYKNYEVLFKAVKDLMEMSEDFQVIVTLDGTESSYSKKMYYNYKNLYNIKFIGLQNRNVINELYKQVDCLVFPSKLETWGLPISEFKAFNKPVLVADMLYANETVGNYDKVNFFPADDHKKLAILMKQFIKNEIRYDGNTVSEPAYPFFNNWNALMAFLTEEKNYSPKQVQQ